MFGKKADSPGPSPKQMTSESEQLDGKQPPRGSVLTNAMKRFSFTGFARNQNGGAPDLGKRPSRFQSFKNRFTMGGKKNKGLETISEDQEVEQKDPWVYDEYTKMWYHTETFLFVSQEGQYFVYSPEQFQLVEIDQHGQIVEGGARRAIQSTENAATKVQAQFRGRQTRKTARGAAAAPAKASGDPAAAADAPKEEIAGEDGEAGAPKEEIAGEDGEAPAAAADGAAEGGDGPNLASSVASSNWPEGGESAQADKQEGAS